MHPIQVLFPVFCGGGSMLPPNDRIQMCNSGSVHASL
jgi:hypothetical protein